MQKGVFLLKLQVIFTQNLALSLTMYISNSNYSIFQIFTVLSKLSSYRGQILNLDVEVGPNSHFRLVLAMTFFFLVKKKKCCK